MSSAEFAQRMMKIKGPWSTKFLNFKDPDQSALFATSDQGLGYFINAVECTGEKGRPWSDCTNRD